MNIKWSRVMATPFLATMLILGSAPIFKGSAIPLKIAQSAEVKGSTVNCDSLDVSVKVPSIKVSAPNPSKLVPNVGRILREGIGVPAPDSEAPNVEASAQATVPDASCDKGASSNETTEFNQSQSVKALW